MSVGSYDPNKPRQGGYGPRKVRLGFNRQTNLIVARPLPPFGSLKDSNSIMFFWSVIWLEGSGGKKFPTASIQRKKNKQIVQADPILEKAAAMKTMIENAQKAGENPQVVAQMLEKVNSLAPDNKCYLNVLTPDGQIAILKIPWTAWTQLEEKLKKLSSQGLDAVGTGPNSGLFFEFKRWKDDKGKTQFSVEPVTELKRDPVTGIINPSYKFAPLDEIALKRIEAEASDLTKLYETRSVEEQAQLATLDPAVISRVMMKSRQQQTDGDNDEPDDTPTQTLTGYQMPTTPAPAPAAPVGALGALGVQSQMPSTPVQPAAPTPPAPAAPAPEATAAPAQTPAAPAAPAAAFPAASGIPDDVRKFLFNNQAAQSGAKA